MADPSSSNAWLPAISVLVGFITKCITDWFQDSRATKRDEERHARERSDQRQERNAIFQRETMLDLQDAIMDLTRASGEIHFHDLKAAQENGGWKKLTQMKEGLSERTRLLQAKTSILLSRIDDKDIREKGKKLKSAVSQVAIATTQTKSEEALFEAGKLSDEINQRIGDVLRDLAALG